MKIGNPRKTIPLPLSVKKMQPHSIDLPIRVTPHTQFNKLALSSSISYLPTLHILLLSISNSHLLIIFKKISLISYVHSLHCTAVCVHTRHKCDLYFSILFAQYRNFDPTINFRPFSNLRCHDPQISIKYFLPFTACPIALCILTDWQLYTLPKYFPKCRLRSDRIGERHHAAFILCFFFFFIYLSYHR